VAISAVGPLNYVETDSGLAVVNGSIPSAPAASLFFYL